MPKAYCFKFQIDLSIAITLHLKLIIKRCFQFKNEKLCNFTSLKYNLIMN